jgi:hypothetical protein
MTCFRSLSNVDKVITKAKVSNAPLFIERLI